MLPRPAAHPRMPHVLQPAGEDILAAALRRMPLLAFDFDGTLTPIVSLPDQARISRAVSGKLQRLANRLPVAVVTGRRTGDVRPRLGFEPHFIVGNHGAEMQDADVVSGTGALQEVRSDLERREVDLARAGIMVEDKGLSLALHYRLSRRPEEARALIREVLRPARPRCRTFSGRMVENVVPAGAPDKSFAVHRLVAHCNAPCAIFVGGDLDDEPVFASAPANWLTIRVGRDAGSRAHCFLHGTAEVGLLLDRMLVHLGNPG